LQFAWMDVNYLGVLVSTLVFMVVGFIWYSPKVFFNTWVKLSGLKEEDMTGAGMAIFGSIITALVTSFVLDLLVQATGSTDWVAGLSLGIVMSVIVAAVIASNGLYSKMGIKLYLITAGYQVITITIAAIILAIWR